VATAVHQLKAWESSPRLAPLTISVNLSARHLGTRSFLSDVLDPLHACGVDPSRLMVEITETALLNDIESASHALAQLRSHGVRIAIDDFGTGYTSLSHLRRLPLDVVKIDRSFVANLEHPDDRSLVRLIVDTGHLLGVSITAEGVETAAQARELLEMGTDSLQGYLFARPAPSDAVADTIGAHASIPSS
jgi:EAL domain-containing protein (putative c-di-GMP-specific phosphodiesterase class I)